MEEKQYEINREVIKEVRFSIILIIFSFLLGLILYSRLPFFVPTSWDIDGHINAYLPKYIAITFLPLLALIILLIFLALPLIDPLRKNYTKFLSTYTTIVNMIITLICVMQIVMLFTIVTGLNKLVPASANLTISIWYIITGNFFPRIKQNWFIGVGTPWTMINEVIWKKTQRFAGYFLFALGVIFFVCNFFGFNKIMLTFDWALLTLLASSLYSFFLYLKLKRSHEIRFNGIRDLTKSILFTVVHIPYWIFLL